MAHFYGVLSGARGDATRCGTKGSGLTATAASWSGAVSTHLWHDDTTGKDHYLVEQRQWHGSGITKVIAEGMVGE